MEDNTKTVLTQTPVATRDTEANPNVNVNIQQPELEGAANSKAKAKFNRQFASGGNRNPVDRGTREGQKAQPLKAPGSDGKREGASTSDNANVSFESSRSGGGSSSKSAGGAGPKSQQPTKRWDKRRAQRDRNLKNPNSKTESAESSEMGGDLKEHSSDSGQNQVERTHARRGVRGGKAHKPGKAGLVQKATAEDLSRLQGENDALQQLLNDAEGQLINEEVKQKAEKQEKIKAEKSRLGAWWSEINIKDADLKFARPDLKAFSYYDQGQVKQYINALAVRNAVEDWTMDDIRKPIILERIISEQLQEPNLAKVPTTSTRNIVGGLMGGIVGYGAGRIFGSSAGSFAGTVSAVYMGARTATKYFTPQEFCTEKRMFVPVADDFNINAVRVKFGCTTLFSRKFMDHTADNVRLARYLEGIRSYAPEIVASNVCHGSADPLIKLRRSYMCRQRYISYTLKSYVSSDGQRDEVELSTLHEHLVDIALAFDCLKPKLLQARSLADVDAAIRSLMAASLHTGPNLISNWADAVPAIAGTMAFLSEIAQCNLGKQVGVHLN